MSFDFKVIAKTVGTALVVVGAFLIVYATNITDPILRSEIIRYAWFCLGGAIVIGVLYAIGYILRA